MQSASNTYFRKAAIWMTLILYVAVLAKFVLFKQSPGYVVRELRKDFTVKRVKQNLRYANFSPGRTINLYLKSNLPRRTVYANIIGNIIGFMPFGFLVPFLFYFLRRNRMIIPVGLLFSLGFEVCQAITGLGRFDVDDLILNTLGVWCGFLAFHLLLFISRPSEIKNPAISGTL